MEQLTGGLDPLTAMSSKAKADAAAEAKKVNGNDSSPSKAAASAPTKSGMFDDDDADVLSAELRPRSVGSKSQRGSNSNSDSKASSSSSSKPQQQQQQQQQKQSDGADNEEGDHQGYHARVKATGNPVLYHAPPPFPEASKELSAELSDDWDSHGNTPGEKLVMRIDNVYYCRAGRLASGELVMTSYQLYFKPNKPTFGMHGIISVPVSTIEALKVTSVRAPRTQRGKRPTPQLISFALDVTTKQPRAIMFGFPASAEKQCRQACQCLEQYVFPKKDEYLFAFYYKPAATIAPEFDGWKLYNVREEYRRMGLPNKDYRISKVNEQYALCDTYPQYLCVPGEHLFSNKELSAVAGFRSRGRLPVLSWKHPHSAQTLWRCSQPRVGMNQTRCEQDERLLATINRLNPNAKLLTIFDCRPKINATANKLAGKGFENVDFYKSCKIRFMNIQNIHVMRESAAKLSKACKNYNEPNFLSSVASSNWLFHISEVIKATLSMVIAMDREKTSIVSHCSDGWDRTSQLVALTQVCMDPYFRTTKGFIVLIEKEWLSIGYKFAQRTGHRDRNASDDQRSPIFLQFLDVVYQLTQQFPRHFEFNSAFMVVMMEHLYSCRFGTFLCDSLKLRQEAQLPEKTVSVWTYLLHGPAARRGEFKNPYFIPNGRGLAVLRGRGGRRASSSAAGGKMRGVEIPLEPSGAVLYPSYSTKKIALWSDYWLRYNTEETVLCGLGPGTVHPFGACPTTFRSTQSILTAEYVKAQTRIKELEARVRKLEEQAAARDENGSSSAAADDKQQQEEDGDESEEDEVAEQQGVALFGTSPIVEGLLEGGKVDIDSGDGVYEEGGADEEGEGEEEAGDEFPDGDGDDGA